MSDHDTVPFSDGHIEVYDTTYRRIQRDGDEIIETPVYDRAHLRIHARGDDGFLATEMTPADVLALLGAVRRHCPDGNDSGCGAPGGHCFERTGIALTTVPPQYPEKCKHCREIRVAVPQEPYAYRYGGPLTDEEAVQVERQLREELAKLATYKVLHPEDQRLILEATTLKPGETLIIRVADLTPTQVQQYQEHIEAMIEHAGLDLRVLIVYGDELAIQQREASEAEG